jgi:large subunit ribosomal protein L5
MASTTTTPRLKQRYREEIAPALLQQLGLTNPMQIPNLEKIVVNIGLGEAVNDAKALEGAMRDLATITGQKPRINRARKSIAAFKLREGMPIGVKVTLRGDRMWEFFDRLLSVAFPRGRDFRGLKPTSFDGHGNYTFGLTEQLVFPEVDYDSIDAVRGMDITIVTTSDVDAHARAFLDAYGFPFVRTQEA